MDDVGMMSPMIRFVGVLGLLLLAACGDEEATEYRSDTLRWFVWPSLQEPSPEDIEAVEDIFGMEMVRADGAFGAVTIYLVEPGPPPLDNWGTGVSCTPHVSVNAGRVESLAHEIGHTHGLGHLDVPGNLMTSTADNGTDLTSEQIDKVRESAWRIESSCIEDEP